MISQIRSLVYQALALSGLPRVMHKRFNTGQLSVLMYHGVTVNDPEIPDWCLMNSKRFQSQMDYLNQHFKVISLSEAEKQLREDTVTGPTAVVTFDDGYQNNYDCAYPILKKSNIPATIFLATNLIDSNSTIWTGLLSDAFSKSTKDQFEWRGNCYDLSSIICKQATLASIKTALKNEPHTQLHKNVELIINSLCVNNSIKIEQDSPYSMLRSDTIRTMAKDPLIDFGAHTHNHPILGNLPPKEQAKEIFRSIELVEQITEKPCKFFAYPNGGIGDYDTNTIDILGKSPIKAALTTIEGTCNKQTPAMEWRRFGIGADMNMATFQLSIHNFIGHIKSSLS